MPTRATHSNKLSLTVSLLSTLEVSTSHLEGECDAPENSFYWLPGHPSKETHRIMADYVNLVLATCTAQTST
ncbi:hypothetical protein R3P38DRAFT_3143549 [Favolaschia claudopus]|uniref:Secreted protein n=1 Tax=Favolaschia claudopus TaxID=2862362 RepID=A0AAV9Z3P3_9AGAR